MRLCALVIGGSFLYDSLVFFFLCAQAILNAHKLGMQLAFSQLHADDRREVRTARMRVKNSNKTKTKQWKAINKKSFNTYLTLNY